MEERRRRCEDFGTLGTFSLLDFSSQQDIKRRICSLIPSGVFNTHRLYSMSAMFPRCCRAFRYAFSASAILPWFFSTLPKFPQAIKTWASVRNSEFGGRLAQLVTLCKLLKTNYKSSP